MVARSPPNRQRKPSAPPISPGFLRETVKKVDKCVARLEELQSTVKGFNLSPTPQNRNVSNLALRCRPEPVRMKATNSSRRSPPTRKVPVHKDDWQKMSLPAMLLGETMGEILLANQVAKKAVETISSNSNKLPTNDDPKTPLLKKFDPTPQPSAHLNPKRTREKQKKRRGETNTPSIHISKSRINFKAMSPECCNKENCRYLANRISPKNRPWVKKSVLFPNPLFHDQKFCKTKSPIIGRKQQQQQRTSASAATPHKFLVKSPAKRQQQQQSTSPPHKFQLKISTSPPHKFQLKIRISPTRSSSAVKRRSFSPSALAKRLVSSPLKCRNSVQKKSGDVGVVRRRPKGFSPRRI